MAKAKLEKTEDAVDFGKAYKELEEIIGWFEREDVDLDEGLKKFERGLQLAKACKSRLKDVEIKVSAIKAKFGEMEDDREQAALI